MNKENNVFLYSDYWAKIYNLAVSKEEYKEEAGQTNVLIQEYEEFGCLKNYTFAELLNISDADWLKFYLFLYRHCELGEDGRPKTVEEKHSKPDWMLEKDYCFLNIRATGKEIPETGNIIDSVKLLPALRVSGIHLAPFFECTYGIVYCQTSFYNINPEIVNLYYRENGVTPYEQMCFLVDCAHLLNMAIGFDFTAHTASFSKLCFDRPELFRWVRLNEKKDALFMDMQIDEQYEDSCQKNFTKELSDIIVPIKENYGLSKIDSPSDNRERENAAYEEIIEAVKKAGYFMVPPHTWNGVCVPDYKRYIENKKIIIWDYRDIEGNDQGQHAIWLHANLYLHKGMKANRLPAQITGKKEDGIVCRNEVTISFIKEYLEEIVDFFRFDYVRMDYVDHIFDNIKEVDGNEIPINEALTPEEILEIVSYLREKHPGLGLQADHMGIDDNLYKEAGFNLITGGEVGLALTKKNAAEIMNAMSEREKGHGLDCSMTCAIDTHDLAHSLFFGKELAHREGKIGTISRFLMSRFANVGRYRRPKYEVIGNQDLSVGIHRANNRPESIFWKNDREVNIFYHFIEDLYEKYKDQLKHFSFKNYEILDNHLVWTIENKEDKKEIIGIIPLFEDTTFVDNQGSLIRREILVDPDRYILRGSLTRQPKIIFSTGIDFIHAGVSENCLATKFLENQNIEFLLYQRQYALIEYYMD